MIESGNVKSKAKEAAVIGLTGGPGTGKSLVANYLKKRGATIISADDVGKRVVNENPAVFRKLVQVFGKSIVRDDGALDRRKLGNSVFPYPDSLRKLNQIVHPPLLRNLKHELKRLKSSHRHKLIVIDAALIFEWGIANWCDYIVTVTARRDIRIRRLMRQGLTRRQAENRISAQIPDREKVKLADYIIQNNGTRVALRRQVGRLLELLGARGPARKAGAGHGHGL